MSCPSVDVCVTSLGETVTCVAIVTRCVTFVTCLACSVKWLNPTRGRPWFFHLNWARGVST